MDFLYQGPEGILRTIIVGVLAYAALIIFLRISGKRTLSKLNAFDLVVTVALGSTLSSILVQKSIALAEGATALARVPTAGRPSLAAKDLLYSVRGLRQRIRPKAR